MSSFDRASSDVPPSENPSSEAGDGVSCPSSHSRVKVAAVAQPSWAGGGVCHRQGYHPSRPAWYREVGGRSANWVSFINSIVI